MIDIDIDSELKSRRYEWHYPGCSRSVLVDGHKRIVGEVLRGVGATRIAVFGELRLGEYLDEAAAMQAVESAATRKDAHDK